MSAQHTPGPWKAECRSVVYQNGEWSKDEFLQWDVSGPDRPSGRGSFFYFDALLVASSPDLLKALKELTHSLDRDDLVHDDQRLALDKAISIIAKATGGAA